MSMPMPLATCSRAWGIPRRTTRLRRGACLPTAALLLTLFVLPAPPAAGQPKGVGGIVSRHIGWLDRVRNYKAEVTVTADGSDQADKGLLLVDNVTRKTAFLTQTQGLPKGVYLKTMRVGDNTQRMMLSRGLSRSDDLPIQEHTLLDGPFPGGSYDLFRRGDGLAQTMNRLNQISNDVTAKPKSKLGEYGLRIGLQADFTRSMADMVDEMLELDSQTIVPPEALVLWFDGAGRLDAVEIFFDSDPGRGLVKFDYKETDLPQEEVMAGFREATQVEADPTLLPQTAENPLDSVEEVAEPFLDSWALIGLSVVLAGVCVFLIMRLRQGPGE